jgi:hypothetical protein
MNSSSVSPNYQPSGVVVHNHHILVWMMIIITLSTAGALLWHFYGPSGEDDGQTPPGGSTSAPVTGGGGSTSPPAGSVTPEPGTTPPATGGTTSPPATGGSDTPAPVTTPPAGSGTPGPYDNSSPFTGLLDSAEIMFIVAAGIVGLLLFYFAEYGPGKITLYNANEDERGRRAYVSRSFGIAARRIPTSVVFFGLPIMMGTGIALMVAGLRGYDTPNEPMWITGLSLIAPTAFYILALAGQFIHRSSKFVLQGILVGVVMIGIALIVIGTTAYDKPNQTMWLTGSILAFPALMMLVRVIDMGVKKVSSRLDERDKSLKSRRMKQKLGSLENTATIDEHVEKLTSKQLLDRMTHQNKLVSGFEKKEKSLIEKMEQIGGKMKKLEGQAFESAKKKVLSLSEKQSELREKIDEGLQYIDKLDEADKRKHPRTEYTPPE